MTMKTLTILFLATLAHTFAAAHSTPWPPTGSSRPMGLNPESKLRAASNLPNVSKNECTQRPELQFHGRLDPKNQCPD